MNQSQNDKVYRKSFFFHTILGFTQSYFGSFHDLPKGFIQILPGTYKVKSPLILLDLIKLIQNVIVNGFRESILFTSAPDRPPGQWLYKELKFENFSKTYFSKT